MDAAMVVAVITVLCAWVVVLVAIGRWGPGRAKRWVQCPRQRWPARVEVEQREGDFGRLRVVDVLACSLFAGKPLSCEKECLGRF